MTYLYWESPERHLETLMTLCFYVVFCEQKCISCFADILLQIWFDDIVKHSTVYDKTKCSIEMWSAFLFANHVGTPLTFHDGTYWYR